MTVDEALRSGHTGLLEAALRRVCFEATLSGASGQQAQASLQNFKQNLLSSRRKSALSATFFEADPNQLARSVDGYVHQDRAITAKAACPKIIIAPHAGHIYSGSVAGKAYALLAAHASRIRRVVMLGPSHRVYFKGIALPGAASFETPLGALPLDTLGFAALADFPFISTRHDAHAQEHCLEVHVPFLQRTLPHAALVPLLVGDVPPQAVAQVLRRLWASEDTVFIISTDLSHFHAYHHANTLDAATCTKILALDATLHHDQACGATPVNGALEFARARGMHISQLQRLNSGDTGGNSPQGRERVVGYASFALYESAMTQANQVARTTSVPNDSVSIANGAYFVREYAPLDLKNEPSPKSLDTLSTSQGQLLVQLARGRLAQYYLGAEAQPSDSSVFQALGATFVTLTQQGQLRGCIGSLQAHQPLALDVQANALAAALHDPRCRPVTAQELPGLRIEVSLLTAPEPIAHASESHALWQLRPGIDGLIFEATVNGQNHRSTYLPQVWDQITEPRAFLAHLKVKAGLPFDFWNDDVRLSRYEVQKFHEQ